MGVYEKQIKQANSSKIVSVLSKCAQKLILNKNCILPSVQSLERSLRSKCSTISLRFQLLSLYSLKTQKKSGETFIPMRMRGFSKCLSRQRFQKFGYNKATFS